MKINFLNALNPKSKMNEFQDLDHIDGVSITTVCANLYNKPRDDLVMFYFRDGANHASVYTKSKIVSENIKWNLNTKSKKVKSLIVNTRNANAFTGHKGYQALKEIADEMAFQLSKNKQKMKKALKKFQQKKFFLDVQAQLVKNIQLKKSKKVFQI